MKKRHNEKRCLSGTWLRTEYGREISTLQIILTKINHDEKKKNIQKSSMQAI
ncbi:hypothetical protein HMPREF1475_01017 [Hoylesella oralis HGA0225]|nr:hypothetical protein HMPREF1475_01017 [Hoylesella oralis HGA0225]ETD16484.1 hypothetical protein HMPREF1199_02152 [Hoylesella oralis CC98A]SHF97302.1 hypothetical protein SAMN05444288_2028 [Hoylesella oralis]